MINEKVLTAVTDLCRRYSKQPPGQIGVTVARTELTSLGSKLKISSDKVYPTIHKYLAYLDDYKETAFKRSDFVKMLIDGMPALSVALEEQDFLRNYSTELADHLDSSKVLDQQLEN